MSKQCYHRCGVLSTPLFLLASAVVSIESAVAQTAPPSAPAARPAAAAPSTAELRKAASDSDPAGETVTLSPFEVRSDTDKGYLATSAQSGTRLRSDLKDIAAAVSVVTKDFMNDIGARNLEDLLVYTLNTEVGGVGGTMSEAVNAQTVNGFEMDFDGALRGLAGSNRVRGLTSADTTRDFFITDAPSDGYNIERFEISRGPNAMLFGLGSPAGIINASTITADTARVKTKFEYRTDQYSSYRGSIDHNQVIAKDKLAVRLASVYDKAYYKVEPAFTEQKRGYLTATFRPFRNTRIKASMEAARQDSNRPRINPPQDAYTWWWKVGKPAYNPSTGTLTLLAPPTLVSAANPDGSRNSNILVTTVATLGQTNNMALVYADPNSSALGMGIPGSAVVGFRSGQLANVRTNAAGTGLATDGMLGLADGTRILNNVIHANDITRNFWKNYQTTDTALYDYYNHMLDGPNKYEWGRWNIYNITLEQQFLDGRAGVELTFDKQSIDNGFAQPFNGQSPYALRIDVNTHLPDGRPNPNFGRPLVAGFQIAGRSGVDRDGKRATAYYNLDLSQGKRAWLGQLLGKHLLTATHTRLENFNESYGSAFAFNSGQDYAIANQGSPQGSSGQGRDVTMLHYIGPNVSQSPTPVGGLATPTSHWPTDVKTVKILWYNNPTPPAGSTRPAAWEERDFSLISNSREDVENTRRGSGIRRQKTEVNSTSIVTQDKFFNGTLVGTLGWRRDSVHSYDAGTGVADPVTGVGINDPKQFYVKPVSSLSQDTFNWGAVAHTPRFIQKYFPWGSELSVSYNKADNFRPTGQRFDMFDKPIGPEVGNTKEYGILLSTLQGRLVLRASHYKTAAAKSSSLVNLSTAVQELADRLNNVADQNFKEPNKSNPALADYNRWVASPAGQTLYNTFRMRVNATNDGYDYDRRGGQVFVTSDVVATGEEYEVIFNPTRNWRISFNAGKNEAVRSNTAEDLESLVNSFMSVLYEPGGVNLTPVGRLVQDDQGNQLGPIVKQSIAVPMLQVTMQDGAPTSELRKWRWNVVNTYSFSEGVLRGWRVGGSVRWQDTVAIGFPVITDPIAGAIPDVKHPYRGPTETNYDAWIGYSRKIGRRVTWNVQVNLKNIGVQDKLVPVSAQPDGSIAAYRISEAQKWTLTNTFSF